MIENFFQSAKENVLQFWNQVQPLFDFENNRFLEGIQPLLSKAMENPLATGIAALALIGIPYTLTKIRKTNTEAGKRLDKLIEELEEFEGVQASLKEKAQSEAEEAPAMQQDAPPSIEQESAEPEPDAAEQLETTFEEAPDEKPVEAMPEENPVEAEAAHEEFEAEPEPEKPAEQKAATLITPLMSAASSFAEPPQQEEAGPPEPQPEAAGLSEDAVDFEQPLNLSMRPKEDVDLDLSDAMAEEHDWARISNPTVAPLREEDFDPDDFEKFQQQMEQTIRKISESIPEEGEPAIPELDAIDEPLPAEPETVAAGHEDTVEIEEPPSLEKEDAILMDAVDEPALLETSEPADETWFTDRSLEETTQEIEASIEDAVEQMEEDSELETVDAASEAPEVDASASPETQENEFVLNIEDETEADPHAPELDDLVEALILKDREITTGFSIDDAAEPLAADSESGAALEASETQQEDGFILNIEDAAADEERAHELDDLAEALTLESTETAEEPATEDTALSAAEYLDTAPSLEDSEAAADAESDETEAVEEPAVAELDLATAEAEDASDLFEDAVTQAALDAHLEEPQDVFADSAKDFEAIQMEIEKTIENVSSELAAQPDVDPLSFETAEEPAASEEPVESTDAISMEAAEETGPETAQAAAEAPSRDFFDGEDLFDVKGLEDIQSEIEKTIQKISEDLPSVSAEEETVFPKVEMEADSAPEAEEMQEALEPQPEEEPATSAAAPEFFPSIQPLTEEIDDAQTDDKKNAASKNEILINRLATFQDLLVKRFQDEDTDLANRLEDPNLEVYSADEVNLKPTGVDSPDPEKDLDENFLDLLESLVILKDQNNRNDRIQAP